jgi:hypothetical protein
MQKERKIALAMNKVRMEDEDRLDVLYWLNRSVSERLAEVTRLRRSYFTWKDGRFPEEIEKVVNFRKL